MINKQNLWFASLFSIILVLSIFYISISDSDIQEFINDDQVDFSETSMVINEESELVALKIDSKEKLEQEKKKLQDILLSDDITVEERNDAYNKLQALDKNSIMEENLIKIIKSDFSLDAFVKINSNNITIVIDGKDDSYNMANNIIKRIQQEFDEDKYITVKFN